MTSDPIRLVTRKKDLALSQPATWIEEKVQ